MSTVLEIISRFGHRKIQCGCVWTKTSYIVKILTRDHVYNFRSILSTQKISVIGNIGRLPVSAKKISAISVKTNIGKALISGTGYYYQRPANHNFQAN